MNTDLSIILATKNRAKLLDEMLSSVEKAAKNISYEIIAIDGGSSDSTVEVLKKHKADIIFNEAEQLGVGRHSWPELYNFGFKYARGKWSMYASDDIIFIDDALDKAVGFIDKFDGSVGGGAFFYKNAIAEEDWKEFGVDLTHGNNVFINYGIVRTDLFKKVGGLDEKYKFYCADGDLCLKFLKEGYKILPLPYSKVIHNNILDVNKQVNLSASEADINYYKKKWAPFFDTGTPNPRRISLAEFVEYYKKDLDVIDRENIPAKKSGTEKKLKLHLGCGERYLDGYVNIDYPPAEHTVQVNTKVDLYADITELNYPDNSIDEVRLHHVFEHFDRSTSLALLCNWHKWLKPGGRLLIETPDFKRCIDLYNSPSLTYAQKQSVLRHVFGSQEAGWAVHFDGWYDEKYQHVLTALGYENIKFDYNEWQFTRNITVEAWKNRQVKSQIQENNAKGILKEFLIDESPSELKMWEVWCGNFEKKLSINLPKKEDNSVAPAVSIFMPVYNGEKYLAETLDSLLAQTYTDFEIIIADDGSSDNTAAVAEEYSRRDKRIKVLKFPHRGEVQTRNDALKNISGSSKYLLNHDSDDISLPNKLETLVGYLDTHPDVAIAGCFAEYFDNEGNYKGAPPLEHEPEKIKATFGKVNSMINSAALIRREVFEKVGNYREAFRSVDDYDFYSRALMSGFKLANVPEVLHKIRLHSQSIGAKKATLQNELAEKIRRNYDDYLNKNIPRNISGLDILITVEFYYPHLGGAEKVVQQLAERLASRGHTVTVATTKMKERNFSELNGVKIVEFEVAGSLGTGISGKDAEKYRDFIASSSADIMFNYAAQQWATDIVFATFDKIYNSRVNIIAPCGYSALKDSKTLRWPQFSRYFREFIPKAVPIYDAAVYHSKAYQDYEFAVEHNFENSMIVPNAVSESEFESSPGIDFKEKFGVSTKYMGLCVANYYEDKGHENIIDAVKKLNRKDFTMVFIGKEGGELNKLKKSAAGLNILFLSDIEREATLAAYHQADLFLFGSKIEAFPLVILEAMASKTPFVSTDCGNVKELKGGIVCDADEIADNVGRILDDEILRKNLAEEGYGDWKENYTWESVTDKYESLFKSLYKKKFAEGIKSRITRIQSGIESNFTEAGPYLQAAKLLIRENKFEEARKYLEDAVELDYQNTEADNLFNIISE